MLVTAVPQAPALVHPAESNFFLFQGDQSNAYACGL
jgi:hypothetical protein